MIKLKDLLKKQKLTEGPSGKGHFIIVLAKELKKARNVLYQKIRWVEDKHYTIKPNPGTKKTVQIHFGKNWDKNKVHTTLSKNRVNTYEGKLTKGLIEIKSINEKKIIKEAYAWERKFGEKLPTLADVQRKKLTEAKAQHGFDLTDFKRNGFKQVLKALKIKPVAIDSGHGWDWKGNGIFIRTGNNPITGEYYSGPNAKFKRKNEKDYASYMGVEGKPELVQQAVELIHKWASYIKNEDPKRRSYI